MVALPASVVAGGSGLATPTTVQNFLAMRAAALQAGIDLKVTSAYRSDAEQLNQYNAVGGNTALAAKPCSLGGPGSNHTSGTALDLTDGCTRGVPNCNTSAYNWLKANGSRWSFNNALPLDLIHWSPSGH
jgi:LAS superfamily LD-carboxypeptidase LdcB